MKTSALPLLMALMMLFVSTAARALPDDPAALKTILETEYDGDPVAYVEANPRDFERMGCRGRVDLLQALMDEGFKLYEVSHRPRGSFFFCVVMRSQDAALAVVLDPDSLYLLEEAVQGADSWTPLWRALSRNNYEITLLVLQNGAGIMYPREKFLHLTREEHFLLAADYALSSGKRKTFQAFSDAGYGHILDAAKDQSNVDYVLQRAGVRSGGGVGSALLGVASVAAGAALGGEVGAAAAVVGGVLGSGDDSNGDDASPGSRPLALATNRAELGLGVEMVAEPHRGLKVIIVLEGGPGEIAGMMADDVITHIAGVPVATRGSLYVSTQEAAKTSTFEVDFIRDGNPASVTFGLPASSAPAPEAESAVASELSSTLEELERLADLRDRGVITEEEFQALKAEILNGDD